MIQGDDLRNAPKNLLTLPAWQFNPVLWSHVATSNYMVPVTQPRGNTNAKAKDQTFIDNNNIWEAILFKELRRTDLKIRLESFFLFEWFPRSPGLYHTENARLARMEAQHGIEKVEDGIVIYNPNGKQSMLEGGIGNIKLYPINLNGTDHYFMSASSNGHCHEGFPVAIPEEWYNELIDEITEKGAIVRTLVGTIRNIPKNLEDLYRGNREVPKFYLQIEDILKPLYPKSRRMEDLQVSVAASFVSNFEGAAKIYASFVNFDPSKKDSFETMVRWMEVEYVGKRYKGKIITDFDETANHFDNASFSLKKVMNLEIREDDYKELLQHLGIDYIGVWQYLSQVKKQVQEKETAVKNTNKVFLSYNHTDGEWAVKIKEALEDEGIHVIMDTQAMETGQRIESFIYDAIRSSGITLSIVSKNSLLSAWVAQETIYSRFEANLRGRKLLPVSIDSEFFREGFVDDAKKQLKKELGRKKRLRSKRKDAGEGTEDLDTELRRLTKLETELPGIIEELRGSLVVDLSPGNFDPGIRKVIADIKKQL